MRIVEPKKPSNTAGRAKGHDWANMPATRALVLCPQLKSGDGQSRAGAGQGELELSPEARLAEAVGLALAIDLEIADAGIVPVPNPKPATLFGSGKVEEIRGLILAERADIVIVDHPLTPVQQRNLEKAWNVKVLDRTGLILEIFGERARTREGTLQVELAHLNYQKSRLVRTWTHLERQRGGYGFMGGPGERQIEADRRMIQERINALSRELESVKRTRKLHREGRKRVPYPVVALVGYTNAGKSTLFNTLTGAEVMAEDMLFATLDPTMRDVKLPGGSRAVLSDTVGFISNLPTTLIAAFRATLEEVIEADLVLLVRDMADPQSAAQLADVRHVLDELGIDFEEENGHLIAAWNKVDLLDSDDADHLRSLALRSNGNAICVSAVTGEGLDALRTEIEKRLNAAHQTVDVTIHPGEGALANWLHENAQIIERESEPNGDVAYSVRLSPAKRDMLLRKLKKRPAA